MGEKSPVLIVNDLVEVCKDAEKGFRDAATEVKEQNLRELFLTQSRQMGQFGKSLEEQVTRLGGKPIKHGSVAGVLHRTFMDLRAVLNLHDSKLVLRECERGEAAVLSHYEKAMDADLPKEVKDVVEKQFVEIVMARNRIHELEAPREKPRDKKYNPLSIE